MSVSSGESILREELVKRGHTPLEIARFIKVLRRDGLLEDLLNALMRLFVVYKLASVVDIEEVEDVEEQYRMLINLLSKMCGDSAYVRPILRRRVNEYKRAVNEILDDLNESIERSITSGLNKLEDIRSKALEELAEVREAKEVIRKLKSIPLRRTRSPEEIVRNVEAFEQLLIVVKELEKKKEVYERSKKLLASIERLIGIIEEKYKEAELVGVKLSYVEDYLLAARYCLAEHVNSKSVPSLHCLVNAERMLSGVLEDVERALKYGHKLIELKAAISDLKAECMSALRRLELDEIADLMRFVGSELPFLPIELVSGVEIEKLRLFLDVAEDLKNGLDELRLELSFAREVNKESLMVKIYPLLKSGLSSVFIKGLAEELRRLRLASLGVEDLTRLYSVWRRTTLDMLRKKGRLKINELTFIPSSWRKRFLEYLAEEESIMIEGDTIILASESLKKIMLLKRRVEALINLVEALSILKSVKPSLLDDLKKVAERLRLLEVSVKLGEDKRKELEEIEKMLDSILISMSAYEDVLYETR